MMRNSCVRFPWIELFRPIMEKTAKRNRNVQGARSMSKYITEDILKLVNYKFKTLNAELTEATVYTDGLQFADYDQKTFHPRLTSTLAISQAASTFAHYKELDSTGKSFRDFRKLTEGRTPFLLSNKMTFYAPFYDIGVSKNPLLVKVRAGHVGISTLGYTVTKYTTTGEILCSEDTTIMIIDRNTRKPVPHPEWWTSKYKTQEHGDTFNANLHHIKKLSPPDGVLRYQIRVTGSEMDLNQHTSWLNYVKFAQDAIYHFVKRNAFKKDINDTIESGKLETIELLYAGETFEGDYLDVIVWKSFNEKADVYTQVIKDSSVVFQGRFQ